MSTRSCWLGIALAAVAPLAGGQELAMKEEAGLRWVCGGVGAEERAALAALRPQANLELLFVTAKRGGYLAGASVTIASAKGAARPVELYADGPTCLISAPPGEFRITAGLDGQERALRASIGTARKAPLRLVFTFPGEPWDGIWADPEEKRQAR